MFDTMNRLPATPAEIAAAAGLRERYVREWLGAMTTGGVVEYDPEAGTFRLPSEHAASLTRTAGPNNIASSMQWVAVLGAVEYEVTAAFRHGRGCRTRRTGGSTRSRPRRATGAPSGRWRSTSCHSCRGCRPGWPRGIDVLDVGCGSGRTLLKMADLFPASRFVGHDVSEESVGRASAVARSVGRRNIRYEVRDAAPAGGRSTRSTIRRTRPGCCGMSLRPGGVFLMQDIRACSPMHGNADQPLITFIYTISCMHCMSVSLAAGGAGLGRRGARSWPWRCWPTPGSGTCG
jgi:hypothetical protein